MNRRYFLMGAASVASAAQTSRPTGVRSANDRVRVACVGVKAQGNYHIKAYSKLPNVEIAAVCDIDESVLEKRLGEIESSGKKRPAGFVDFRKMLEDKSIDAVSIATPDHHHTLQTVWACQAGKDVYVEKPCAHDMFEARQIVAAARRYERVVQHGTNMRSDEANREAVRQIRNGLIGDVYMARAVCFKWRDTIGRTPVEPVPPGVDYDLWLGPAPSHAFTRNRFHYNWHWFWDYGSGDLGNQGIHHLDAARWGLGVKYPTRVSASGGHFMFDDDQETPNTIFATFEFESEGRKKILVCEVRHWITNKDAGIGGPEAATDGVGNLFYGSKGYMALEGYYGSYRSFLGREQTPGPTLTKEGDNWGNFIDVVRSRKREDLNAPIEEGAISMVLVHLANISYRVGRSLRFDGDAYGVVGDAEANDLFRRQYRAPFVVPDDV